jgi:hypothetical protein
MCVYVYVCSSITLERLEQFQPNLVHTHTHTPTHTHTHIYIQRSIFIDIDNIVDTIPYGVLFVIFDIMWQFCKTVLHYEIMYFVVIIFPVQYNLQVFFSCY